jgi:hypothetical protein
VALSAAVVSSQLRTLRALTIFDGAIFTVFEVRFPFQFPHAVGESGKRNWEPGDRRRGVGRSPADEEIRTA